MAISGVYSCQILLSHCLAFSYQYFLLRRLRTSSRPTAHKKQLRVRRGAGPESSPANEESWCLLRVLPTYPEPNLHRGGQSRRIQRRGGRQNDGGRGEKRCCGEKRCYDQRVSVEGEGLGRRLGPWRRRDSVALSLGSATSEDPCPSG